jgi:predicted nuclease of predicted toxin-antitoxin system
VKLLLDENLSPRLIGRLASLFSGLKHVRDIGLKQASDEAIWDWARINEYTVVTTDADFVALCNERGSPPKIIHLEECDFPLRIIEELLRANAVRISEFERDPAGGVLTIRLGPKRRTEASVGRS